MCGKTAFTSATGAKRALTDAGVVDQHVDLTELAQHLCDVPG
jgi:hypothetical protein